MRKIITIVLISSAFIVHSQTIDSAMKNEKLSKTNEQWKQELTEEEYNILRNCGTEPPFTGKYYKHNEKGTYHCAACGAKLFSSDTKYDSGSGWPSFYDAIDKNAIKEISDNSFGMQRIEIKCAKCDGHLGHVFPDGPRPTGLRYCVNSVSLNFKDANPKKED